MVLLATTDGTPAAEKEAVVRLRRAPGRINRHCRLALHAAEDRAANAELAAELDRYCRNGGRVGVLGQPVPARQSRTGIIRSPSPTKSSPGTWPGSWPGATRARL